MKHGLFHLQPVLSLHSWIIISFMRLEDKPLPGLTPVFEFVDPDVQVKDFI